MKYLREWRKRNTNFSMEKLADIVGVHLNSVVLWETTDRDPGIEHIPALCEALHVTTDELLFGPQEHKYKTTLQYGDVRKELKDAVTDFTDLKGFRLTIDPSGAIAINGGRPLKTKEERDSVLKELCELISDGYDLLAKRGLSEK